MCARVLKENGQIISRSSVIPLSQEDKERPAIAERKQNFEQTLKDRLGAKYDPTGSQDDIPEDELTPEHEPMNLLTLMRKYNLSWKKQMKSSMKPLTSTSQQEYVSSKGTRCPMALSRPGSVIVMAT